jgi:flotillin
MPTIAGGQFSMFWLVVFSVAAFVVFFMLIAIIRRYKRCPSDKIMVIYGKVSKGQTAHCIHGGAAFIWPVIQDYQFLDLQPIQIEVDLDNALSKQNIRVSVPSNFTVGISTKPEIIMAAAERLLGMEVEDIKNLARDIIIGQMRLVIATMEIEEINADRDKFLEYIYKNVETELEKIGLRLINVNIKDLQDESGYIASLGKKAAADALNKAKKDVAEKDRDGAIGEAEARREQVIKVTEAQAASASGQANATKGQRINVANANAEASVGEASAQQLQRVRSAEANARAVEGENKASIDIANSTSEMRERKAEAERKASAAEKVQSAKALQEAYEAEKLAEQRRAERDYASQQADIVVRTKIEKEQKVIDAEAEAAKIQKIAEGEAAAIFVKMEAQARGIQAILSKQADGLLQIVKAAGNDPTKAATLLIIDKLPDLVKTQVEAIKNIKIDKITVWDSAGGSGGKPTTANFLSGLMGSVPPLQELFKMAGMSLPEYLGKMTAPQTALKTDSPQVQEEKK